MLRTNTHQFSRFSWELLANSFSLVDTFAYLGQGKAWDSASALFPLLTGPASEQSNSRHGTTSEVITTNM